MTPEVKAAIDEIAANYPNSTLVVAPDQQGGSFVELQGIPLGEPYEQEATWIGFHITHSCPYADVYPHFVRSDLSRKDKRPLGEGFGQGQTFPPNDSGIQQIMPARPAVQISRRSNHRDSSGLETPLLKLMKVIRWLQSR